MSVEAASVSISGEEHVETNTSRRKNQKTAIDREEHARREAELETKAQQEKGGREEASPLLNAVATTTPGDRESDTTSPLSLEKFLDLFVEAVAEKDKQKRQGWETALRDTECYNSVLKEKSVDEVISQIFSFAKNKDGKATNTDHMDGHTVKSLCAIKGWKDAKEKKYFISKDGKVHTSWDVCICALICVYFRFICGINRNDLAPAPENIFRALRETALDRIKVVLVGQDPDYHRAKNESAVGKPCADGLAFSRPKGYTHGKDGQTYTFTQSLLNLYNGLLKKAADPKYDRTKDYIDLQHWCQDGVLLLNACLTLKLSNTKEEENAVNHFGAPWLVFTRELIHVVAQCAVNTGKKVLYFFFGTVSHTICIPALSQYVVLFNHPSPKALKKEKKKKLEPYIEKTIDSCKWNTEIDNLIQAEINPRPYKNRDYIGVIRQKIQAIPIQFTLQPATSKKEINS